MKMLPFLAYSALGMALWTILLTWIGFKLGENYALLENYIGPVGTAVIFFVLLLWLYRIFRSRKRGREEAKGATHPMDRDREVPCALESGAASCVVGSGAASQQKLGKCLNAAPDPDDS